MKKMLYVVTNGPDAPRKLYLPFILAEDAVDKGWQATMFFTMKGVLVLKREEAKKIKVEKLPRLDAYITSVIEKGVNIFAQQRALEVFDFSEPDFMEGVEVKEGRMLNKLVFEVDETMYF